MKKLLTLFLCIVLISCNQLSNNEEQNQVVNVNSDDTTSFKSGAIELSQTPNSDLGQDTIAFYPLEVAENLDVQLITEISAETDTFLLTDIYDEQSGAFLLNKQTNTLYSIVLENMANTTLDINFVNEWFIKINCTKMASGVCEAHYVWSYIVDIERKTVAFINAYHLFRCLDEKENECSSEIKITDKTLNITKNCISKEESFCNFCASSGKYHYINGNFVKVK